MVIDRPSVLSASLWPSFFSKKALRPTKPWEKVSPGLAVPGRDHQSTRSLRV
jgi:hypothetical protein